MMLIPDGLNQMAEWVRDRAPDCLPDEFNIEDSGRWKTLFPHSMREADRVLSPNELLVELAGRKCYNSFGLKAGRKTNREYIAQTQVGDIPHASIMYHAKMTFFIGGVSRRVSHEIIRHYVGADRTEEGSPSQESTRYVEHAGCYIAHPAIIDNADELSYFKSAMGRNYREYLDYIRRRTAHFEEAYSAPPKGMDRKRIFESASPYLSHSCETSFIWTSNPIALQKMFKERANEFADLEYQRLAKKWKRVCLDHAPNLFPESWKE
jgi:thymidylate synthase (FAD)